MKIFETAPRLLFLDFLIFSVQLSNAIISYTSYDNFSNKKCQINNKVNSKSNI